MKEYITERGVTVTVVPIPLLLDEIEYAHPGPARPTYTEHLAGGATQDVEITEQMAATWAEKDPDTWAEHAEAWAEYVAERDAVQRTLNERIWQAVKRKALRVDLPDDDGWIEDQGALGLTVPTEPKARRLHYIQTEVIGGMRDVLRLTAMARGTDISEEAIRYAEASFRRDLARQILEGFTSQEEGAVGAGKSGRANAGSEGVGAETERPGPL